MDSGLLWHDIFLGGNSQYTSTYISMDYLDYHTITSYANKMRLTKTLRARYSHFHYRNRPRTQRGFSFKFAKEDGMADTQGIKKIVLAYSGGLDTSVIVPWLRNNYNNVEVICFCADLGQEEELAGLEEKAIKSGASKLYIRDLREEFLTDFVFPTLQAGAVDERDY